MSFDDIPNAKRPKFDDTLLPGPPPPGAGIQRESSIASTGGDKNKDSDSFPQQLMKMLNDPANADIVAWMPGGDAFIVHSKDQFVTEVMPAYFGKRSKFTSFTRKLNRWGFARNNQGDNKGAYSHPLFHRDDPTSHMKMSCASQPGQGTVRGRGNGGGGGGKAKRRNSGPMAMSKANAQAEAGLMAAAAAGEAPAAGGAGAVAGLAAGVGLITPHIAHGQLTSQMMFGSQGFPDGAGGFTGLSPFGAHGFTPMAMTPGTLSIAGLTPGGVTGLTPGTLTPGILSGLSPMMQINATAAGQGFGAELGDGAAGGGFGLPPPPPLAGATADSGNTPNIGDNTEHNVLGSTDTSGDSQTYSQEQRDMEDQSQQQPSQPQQVGNLASSNNPLLNMGMPFPGGMMGNFANAQQFLQMQQQRVQQQLQAQQMQLLQLQRQQAALANSSNAGSLEGPVTAVPPKSGEVEGVGDSGGVIGTEGGDDDLADFDTGGLGGTGFSPAPPDGDDHLPTGPVSGNDSMQLIQQMQARLHQQQQLLNGSSLQLQAGANGVAGMGGAMLPAGAEPDPLPAVINPQGQGSMMNGTIGAPGHFRLQQLAGGVAIGNNPLLHAQMLAQTTSQGEAPIPATTSGPTEEQSNMPNIADSNNPIKGAIAQPDELAAGTTLTPVADAQ